MEKIRPTKHIRQSLIQKQAAWVLFLKYSLEFSLGLWQPLAMGLPFLKYMNFFEEAFIKIIEPKFGGRSHLQFFC